jgi:hypothetical protein
VAVADTAIDQLQLQPANSFVIVPAVADVEVVLIQEPKEVVRDVTVDFVDQLVQDQYVWLPVAAHRPLVGEHGVELHHVAD